ncbi:hypothetical protein ACP275_10G037900 [Erythranthe tilingii]
MQNVHRKLTELLTNPHMIRKKKKKEKKTKKMPLNFVTSVLPVMMVFPANRSAKMHPPLHKSTPTPYSVAPKSNSGGLYQRVTTRLVIGCLLLGSKVEANPKSAILRTPPSLISRFDPLISRCNTCRSLQCSRPDNN